MREKWCRTIAGRLRPRSDACSIVESCENACDEAVLASGSDPQTYAESILKVCRFYVHSPLACASGVSGADLKKRIEVIMESKFAIRLNTAKKGLLAGCAATVIAAPLADDVLKCSLKPVSAWRGRRS